MYNQFYGYNSETMTFEHRTKDALNGKPITLKGNDGISPCNDGDIIIKDSIDELLNIDISNYYVAASYEFWAYIMAIK